jgi:hypothetical protein
MKSKALDSGNKFARTFNRLSLTSLDKHKHLATLSAFLSFSPPLFIRQRSVRKQVVAVGEEDKGIGH